jgi:hypothetical protein
LAYVLGGDDSVLFSLVYLHRVGVSSNTDIWASILSEFIVFFHTIVGEFPELG